jgi:hypothetical protein
MGNNLAETQAILLFFWVKLLKLKCKFGIIGLEACRRLSLKHLYRKFSVNTIVAFLEGGLSCVRN